MDSANSRSSLTSTNDIKPRSQNWRIPNYVVKPAERAILLRRHASISESIDRNQQWPILIATPMT